MLHFFLMIWFLQREKKINNLEIFPEIVSVTIGIDVWALCLIIKKNNNNNKNNRSRMRNYWNWWIGNCCHLSNSLLACKMIDEHSFAGNLIEIFKNWENKNNANEFGWSAKNANNRLFGNQRNSSDYSVIIICWRRKNNHPFEFNQM